MRSGRWDQGTPWRPRLGGAGGGLDKRFKNQPGAFFRSFNAFERTNTGSAKNTPKSDMDLLARMQHFASLN